MQFSRKCLLLVFVLLTTSPAWAITETVVVLTTATELSEYFAATARERSDLLEVSLSPTAKWAVIGEFRGYTLKKLPFEVTPDNVEKVHYKHSHERFVESTTSRQARFAVKQVKVSSSYVVAHFNGGLLQDAQMVEVCIPFTAFRLLLDTKPKPKE